MTRYVFDTSALLCFTDKERGWPRVEQIINESAGGRATILMSAVNWGEIALVLYRRYGLSQGNQIVQKIRALPITIVPLDASAAEGAGIFQQDFHVPYAHAFAGSLTLKMSAGHKKDWATLVTADHDFKNVPTGTLQIELVLTK
jgi:PIN domain nuclease of toxin-antitoxin system